MKTHPPLLAADVLILDLGGPDFLMFYGIAFAVALVLSLALRAWGMGKHSIHGAEHTELTDPYELAYLAGGAPRCAQVAMLRLVEAGGAAWASGRLLAAEAPPAGLERIERALYEAAIKYGKLGIPAGQVRLAVARELRGVEARLAAKGLRPTHSERVGVWGKSILPFFLLLLIGGVKLMIGLDRGRPVGFLVICLIVTVIAMVIVARTTPRLTRAALRMLKRRRNAQQQQLPHPERRRHPSSPAPATAAGVPDLFLLTTALALLGPEALASFGHPLAGDAAFRQQLRDISPSSGTSSSGCSSGCSSGGGDGGSGCGGGGGCGGCGGGGGGD